MEIIITGYYKKNNYGDDLFESIADKIFQSPHTDIKNYKIVTISQLQEAVRQSPPDIIVLFGGEVLNDFFLDELVQIYKFNPKIIFKAIGVSCNQDYCTLTNKMHLFETVIFRTQKDYIHFKDILSGRCYFCPDIVFPLSRGVIQTYLSM